MTHDPREALEPCPFCGAKLDIDRNISDTGVYWVMCHQCCAEGPPVNPKAEAIKAWNTRALTASPGVVSVELLNIERATGDRLRSENDKLRATIASPGEQKPVVEGYVLVPVEPTPEIIRAMHHKIDWCRDDQNTYEVEHPSQNPNGVGTTCKQDICDAYRAMIEALRREAPAPEGVALADWSDLPKDIYVTSAKRVNAVGYDVQCCSVPMVTSPEVRYVRADMITAPPSRPDAWGGVREDNRFRYFAPEKLAVIPEGTKMELSLKTTTEMMAERDAWLAATVKCPTCGGKGRVSTQPAAAESSASVEARLRERVHFYRNHSDAPVYSGKHVANILETVFALAAVGDEANESRRSALAQSEEGK